MAFCNAKDGLSECERPSFVICTGLWQPVAPWLLFVIAYRVYPVGDVFEDFGRDGFFYLSVFDGEAGGACLEQVVEAGVGLYGV